MWDVIDKDRHVISTITVTNPCYQSPSLYGFFIGVPPNLQNSRHLDVKGRDTIFKQRNGLSPEDLHRGFEPLPRRIGSLRNASPVLSYWGKRKAT